MATTIPDPDEGAYRGDGELAVPALLVHWFWFREAAVGSPQPMVTVLADCTVGYSLLWGAAAVLSGQGVRLALIDVLVLGALCYVLAAFGLRVGERVQRRLAPVALEDMWEWVSTDHLLAGRWVRVSGQSWRRPPGRPPYCGFAVRARASKIVALTDLGEYGTQIRLLNGQTIHAERDAGWWVALVPIP